MVVRLLSLLACTEPPADSTGTTAFVGHSADGHTATGSMSGHSAVVETGQQAGHTGEGTAETGAPPGTLPACDLSQPPPQMAALVVRPVDQLRSAAIYGLTTRDHWFGDHLEVVSLASGERLLVVRRSGLLYMFSMPITSDLASSDAHGSTDTSLDSLGVGRLVGDAGDDLAVGVIGARTLYVASPPLPEGYQPIASVASATADAYDVGALRDLDAGDWDGDGDDDLFLSWRAGGVFGSIRVPPLPYPFGGSALYLGPLPATPLSLLNGDAPAAWYDLSALDIQNPGATTLGDQSRLIPDIDGDGRADVLAAFQGGRNAVPRHPPTVDAYDSGGFAVFTGSRPGLNLDGDARNLVVATCNSDTLDYVCGRFAIATRPQEVGDVDADGHDDLVFLADEVEVPGGCKHVAFVVTELPRSTGPATYTQLSSTIVMADHYLHAAVTVDDLNGDALDELVISMGRLGASGSAFLFLSPFSGTLAIEAADLEIAGGLTSGQEFGTALLSAELDGDGVPDLAIGDISDRNFTGAVHIVSGAAIQQALGL